MKLQKFNRENCTQRMGGGMSTITIHSKGGVSISRAASEAIGLKKDQTIGFFFDEDDEEWYIGLDKDGFSLREIKGGGHVFQSASLAKKFLEQNRISEKWAKYKLAPEATMNGKQKLYAILLSSCQKPS